MVQWRWTSPAVSLPVVSLDGLSIPLAPLGAVVWGFGPPAVIPCFLSVVLHWNTLFPFCCLALDVSWGSCSFGVSVFPVGRSCSCRVFGPWCGFVPCTLAFISLGRFSLSSFCSLVLLVLVWSWLDLRCLLCSTLHHGSGGQQHGW